MIADLDDDDVLATLSQESLLYYRGKNDLTDSNTIKSLSRSIEACYRGLEESRTLNRALVESYAGPAYGAGLEKRKKYLNKLRQAVVAYVMMLAANRPTVEISTKYEPLKAFAKDFEVAINNLLEEINLKQTIQKWVLDAYFCVGVVKQHRKDSGQVELEPNIFMDPGQPFASNVLLDDFVFDMGAKSWDEIKWAGDMYRLPISMVKQGIREGIYDPSCEEYLKPTSKFYANSERLEKLSIGQELDLDEYEPMVDLCDIWIRRHNKVYTFLVDDRNRFRLKHQPIAVMEWNNPDQGPYHILGFDDVPGNILPASPAADLDELDRLINSLLAKQARQARRQKDGIIFSAAGAQTAKRVRDSGDGDMIQGNPDHIKPYAVGGVNPVNQAFLVGCLDLFNDIGGNITALLGLGSQAETLGQEQIIQNAGSRKIGHMQGKVVDATVRLVRALGLDLWEDEFKEITGQRTIAGTDIAVDATWRPGDREGNFFLYNFDVNVYSMTYRPPAAQVELVQSLLANVYAPFMEQMAAQGAILNFEVLNNKLAENLNMSWLKELVSFASPTIPDEQPSSGSSSRKSPFSRREYVRKNVATGGSPKSQAMEQSQAWMRMAASNDPAGAMTG